MIRPTPGKPGRSENLSVNKRTKHIDIKNHFIREFVRNGFGKIYKIESKDCVADIGTKNQEVSLFVKHEFESDDGFPTLRNKVYGRDGILVKDFGGMSEERKCIKILLTL